MLLWAAPAGAADHELRGVALVIGQSKYEELPALANPSKDARDIDRLLGDLGFDVDRVLNADGDELHEAFEDFIDDARDADVALVYYSGHGIEAKGENFLAPIDTDLSTPETAGASMVAVQPLLQELSKAAPVVIVLLDACRSDPFPPGQTIVLPGDSAPTPVQGQGLAAVRGPTPIAKVGVDPDSLGTVIGFAAEPGAPALDGAPGENSPYAAALLKHFAAGGYSFGDVMTMVTEEVYLKTRAQQLPWTNSSLRRVLSFAAAEPEEGDADQSAIRTERRKLLLSIAGTPEETQRYVEALAGQEDVPLDALYGMLNVLGIKTSDNNGNLEQQLQAGAERLKQLLAEKTATVKADPELARLSQLADDAEAEGAIALALQYRDAASQRADSLLSDRRAEADRLRQDMIDIAQTYADNAATALLNFDHAHAAELFGKAYAAAKDWDAARALEFKINEGDALSDRGYYNNDNAAVTAAIAAYNEALALAPESADPAHWGALQDRIGQAHQMLGMRLSDPATLEASIGFYDAALRVRTAELAPQDWAKSQNNLANALYTLGQRRNDIALLNQAVSAFDAALTVFTHDAEPVKWATVENNRASVQIAIAQMIYASTDNAEVAAALAGNSEPTDIPEVQQARAEANAAIGQAVAQLTAALDVGLRDSNPFDWAMLQHTYGSAYQLSGEMNHSVDDLRKAAEAYRQVLDVYRQDRTPAQWVRSSNNLAVTLKRLADESKDAAPLRQAVEIYRAVIAATPKADLPLDWADYQQNLGNALASLSDYEDADANLAAALDAFHAAEEITTLDRGATKWEGLQNAISTTMLYRGLKTFDRTRVQAAYDLAVATRDKLRDIGQPDDAYFAMMLPMVEQVLELLPK